MISIFLADGFEEIEALTTLDILHRAGCAVKTVGIGGEVITSTHGLKVLTDLRAGEVRPETLEAVVLPGGMPGARNLEQSGVVRNCVFHCVQENLPVAAICAAPYILGKWGLLEGKEAICYPGFESELHGATLSEQPVCRDGQILTAKGAGVALEFALTLTEMLKGKETAERIRKEIQCR